MYFYPAPGDLDLTEDGFDIQWGTNVVGKFPHLYHTFSRPITLDDFTGPFYLTQLLLPALLTAGSDSEVKKARVMFTASIMQEKLTAFDTFIDSPARKKLSPAQRYGQSKLVSFAEPGVVLTVKDMFLS